MNERFPAASATIYPFARNKISAAVDRKPVKPAPLPDRLLAEHADFGAWYHEEAVKEDRKTGA